MPINQFTSQSGWANGYSVKVPDITASNSNPIIVDYTATGIVSDPMYNFTLPNAGFKPDQVGIYLINVSLSTSGADNDQIQFGCADSNAILTLMNVNGLVTSFNYNTIIDLKRITPIQFYISNFGRSGKALKFNTFNVAIIKIY